MCDTVVARAHDGSLWLAKNSDREPGEAQGMEHQPRARRTGRLRCTHLEIEDVAQTNELVVSRPAWMWGAEMGVNEWGLAIGNEAVFTRLPIPALGLTGMDLLRLALERSKSAGEALELITSMVKRHGQGGAMGFRNRGLRYASSFLLVDAREAWVLETAGQIWAAKEVARAPGSVYAISNGLTIGADAERLDDNAVRLAGRRGRTRVNGALDFRSAFEDRIISRLAGAAQRRACLTAAVAGAGGTLDAPVFFEALRGHVHANPTQGLVMTGTCGHAAPWPTRTSGQTTASLVAHLRPGGPEVWATGTSSPCLSVFKRVPLATGLVLDTGPAASVASDRESLWWRHERLHRAVLAGWETRGAAAATRARALESDARDDPEAWRRHRECLPAWLASTESQPASLSFSHRRYWNRMNRLDGL